MAFGFTHDPQLPFVVKIVRMMFFLLEDIIEKNNLVNDTHKYVGYLYIIIDDFEFWCYMRIESTRKKDGYVNVEGGVWWDSFSN